MEHLDISGKDKAVVLAALYNASRQQGMGLANPAGRLGMTVDAARAAIEARAALPLAFRLSFDYLHGRVLKVELSGDTFNPAGYDRDNGPGAAAHALVGV